MLRTIAQMRADEAPDLAEALRAAQLPTGPWATDELAKADINAATKDIHLGGGGWGVVFGGTKQAVSGRRVHGRLHVLKCMNNKKSHGLCTWTLTLEECVEGWAIRSFHPHPAATCVEGGHNHALSHTNTESMARSSMREIPPALVEIGKAMVLSGIGISKVFHFLKARAEKDSGEALFTYLDVYHACGASTGERRLDATKLVETLRQREVERGLFQRITTDEEGCLKQVFFQLEGSTAIYANEPEKQVVEIDHKVLAATSYAERLLTCRLCSTAPTRTGSS